MGEEDFIFLSAFLNGTAYSVAETEYADLDAWLTTSNAGDVIDGLLTKLNNLKDYMTTQTCDTNWCLVNTDVQTPTVYSEIPVDGGYDLDNQLARIYVAYPLRDEFYANLDQPGCGFLDVVEASITFDTGDWTQGDLIGTDYNGSAYVAFYGSGGDWGTILPADLNSTIIPKGMGFVIQLKNSAVLQWTLPEGCE